MVSMMIILAFLGRLSVGRLTQRHGDLYLFGMLQACLNGLLAGTIIARRRL